MSETKINRRIFGSSIFLLSAPVWVLNGFMWGMTFQRGRDNSRQKQNTDDQDADKEAAVQQMAAQIAENSSPVITVGFRDLAVKNPWLSEARKAVGRFDSGTAILIDYDGTIVLCAHETPGKNPSVNFWPTDKVACEAALNDLTYDKEHDVMFGSISPDLIEQYGLKPVGWSKIGYDDSNDGIDIVAVGWPAPSMRLHATAGKIASFEEKVTLSDKMQYQCKMAANLVAFPGMSGGGIFYKGTLVGILNSSNDPGNKAQADFTPADFIYTAYEELFPARARKAGFSAIKEAVLPDACQFNRRQFLSKVLTPGQV